MAEPGKKPFNYERAKQLMQTEGKSPGFYNELESRILEYERANGITSEGMDDGDVDDMPQAAPSHVTEPPAVQIEGDPDRGLWESLTDPNNWGDMGRGAAQGASFGLADEGAARVQSWLGSPLDGQRAAGRGFDAPLMTPEQERAQVLADERGANAQARERSPWLYGGGAVAGALPAAIATAPATGGAGLAMRAGQNALHGAALGTAAGYGASEGETDAEILRDAGGSAALGGALGAGGTVVGAGVSAAARGAGQGLSALADKAQRAGLRNRAAATGVYGGELAKMARQRGRDIAERIGGAIEKYGAHKRPEGGMLPRWLPQSAGVYADTTEAAMKQAGQQMSGAVDDATAAGAAISPQSIMERLGARRAEHIAKNVPDEDAVAESIDEIVARMSRDKMSAAGGTAYSPRDAFDKRLAMKGMAKLDSNRNVMPEASYKAQAYREGRDAIGDAMREAMSPDQAARFGAANEDYGLLKMANNASRQREAQELGNQLQSMMSPGMAGAGAVVQGVPGAAAGIGVAETVKRVGRDVMADTLGGTATALRGAARVPNAIGAAATPAGNAARFSAPAMADDADSIFEQFLGAADASPAGAQPQPQTQRDLGTHPLVHAADVTLRAGGRDLGKWKPELEAARQKGPQAFAATVLRLRDDPEFARTVLPVLNDHNARTQGAQR